MRHRWLPWLCAALAAAAAQDLPAADYPAVPGGRFASVVQAPSPVAAITIAPFRMAATPATNAEYAEFVRRHPRWRRDRVTPLFADTGYLQHWPDADAPAPAQATQPVTWVSWFAAQAYCEDQGGRLPTWFEWEFAAAADEQRTDARDDPAWRQRMLDWYARPASAALPAVGAGAANVYGLHDLHGLVWEWVDDAGSLMVSADNREQGSDPDLLKFCGTGALTMQQKEHYAVLMRIAMLSSLKAAYTTASLGVRCVRDAQED